MDSTPLVDNGGGVKRSFTDTALEEEREACREEIRRFNQNYEEQIESDREQKRKAIIHRAHEMSLSLSFNVSDWELQFEIKTLREEVLRQKKQIDEQRKQIDELMEIETALHDYVAALSSNAHSTEARVYLLEWYNQCVGNIISPENQEILERKLILLPVPKPEPPIVFLPGEAFGRVEGESLEVGF